MTLKISYRTEIEAVNDLLAHGFKAGASFYTKPSTDGFGFPMTALATVKLNKVAPEWNEPNFYTVQFHN